MKRGTKPAPTPLKVLQGTRKCRVNQNEPAPPEGAPTPPAYLDAEAAGFWAEVAPLLTSMRVLTVADRHSLALLCDSFSRWRSDVGDHKRRDEYRKLLAEFGLTPSSRSGLKVEPAKPRDRLAELMARKAR